MQKMNNQIREYALNKLFNNVVSNSEVSLKYFNNPKKASNTNPEEFLSGYVITGNSLGISYSEFTTRVIHKNTDYFNTENSISIWNAISPESIQKLLDAGWSPLTVYLESRCNDEYSFALIVKDCATMNENLKIIRCNVKRDSNPVEQSLFEKEIDEFLDQPDNKHNNQ